MIQYFTIIFQKSSIWNYYSAPNGVLKVMRIPDMIRLIEKSKFVYVEYSILVLNFISLLNGIFLQPPVV